MNERVAKTGLVAFSCGALAVTGFTWALRAETFAPCRVRYRLPQAVQDSLACHIYSAISLASLFFLVVAVGFGIAAGALLLLRR